MYNLYNIMAFIVDIFIMIVLLILTIYTIIYNISSMMDTKLSSLKNDIVNIKINPNNNPNNNVETFSGSLSDDGSSTERRDDKTMDYISNQINPSTEDILRSAIMDDNLSGIENPNFNTLNNLPFIINPQNPNEGYYYNRVKLTTNPNSPLLEKAYVNMQKINSELKKCSNKNLTNDRDITGYNNYENLSEDSYANITSIGKSLLTPYSSYPLPS